MLADANSVTCRRGRTWIALLFALLLASALPNVRFELLAAEPPARPNILWISCEDISLHLGCYGDKYAVTPHLDRLASDGLRFTHAFAVAGVCAPSRSSLITGMYACSLGTHPMRCQGKLPRDVQCFPQYLREAGYYCTNRVKTDYNFTHPPATWDVSSPKAHYRQRRSGQPFFAVVNLTTTHESQIRLRPPDFARVTAKLSPAMRHDPTQATPPPYHPDTPVVKEEWAHYADLITVMDLQVGELLKELDDAGLTDDTIVFFFSDHGAGMPRSKRWLYDSGTRVPFIVRCPARFRDLLSPLADSAAAPSKGKAAAEPIASRFALAGSVSNRLVSMVDFAPSVLGLCGVAAPKHMQGQAFVGDAAAKPREYVFGIRDRMDERTDMLRSVRDARYKYIRNYLPHLPWFHSQHISYMYQMQTMAVWERLAQERRLTGSASFFMEDSKPTEELYDTEADPHEMVNLATRPEHRERLQRLRRAHVKWREEILDLGLLPEADLRARFGDAAEYAAVRGKPELFPLRHIAAAADAASDRDPANMPRFKAWLADADPAVRYWACVGLGALATSRSLDSARAKGEILDEAGDLLAKQRDDKSPIVRIAAADGLCWLARHDRAIAALSDGLKNDSPWVRLAAIQVVDRIDHRAAGMKEQIGKLLQNPKENEYVVRVAQRAFEELTK